jgi:protocatechuate 3,4-dioxygenase beta subunit
MFRQNITEGRPGLPLNVELVIVNVNNKCSPIPNARIDIWHCDRDGVYSGYIQPGVNTVGQTFMRGIQITDSNGKVTFKTVYPGWYPGRITHIHFEIFINSVLSRTSQIAFPIDTTTEIYNNATLYPKGQNTLVTSFETDNVFNDLSNTALQIAEITNNEKTDGKNALLIVGIAPPITGIQNLEPETGGQFKLNQNFPNPFHELTTIPFNLTNPANIRVDLFDLEGRQLGAIIQKNMAAGDQSIAVDAKALNLSSGPCVYQLTVENEYGVFRQCKLMARE